MVESAHWAELADGHLHGLRRRIGPKKALSDDPLATSGRGFELDADDVASFGHKPLSRRMPRPYHIPCARLDDLRTSTVRRNANVDGLSGVGAVSELMCLDGIEAKRRARVALFEGRDAAWITALPFGLARQYGPMAVADVNRHRRVPWLE
jgi:hypothetical protein